VIREADVFMPPTAKTHAASVVQSQYVKVHERRKCGRGLNEWMNLFSSCDGMVTRTGKELT
jgi:hypothetical protein